MAAHLVGGRHALHVARRGAHEAKIAHDYYAVHPGDIELDAPMSDLIGFVHSYEAGSTMDGPGLRFVAVLTGCVLRCRYCHSPDTWHKQNGQMITVSRMMKTVGQYAPALALSRSGITLSGGEPVLQRAFVMEIFRRCKALGLHTCLDTCGRLGDRLTDTDLADIDLNLLDIKSGDARTHERVTGEPLQPTLDYAQRLCALGRPMWIRYPLVPGLTDDFDNVEKAARFCGTLRTVERVEVLKFHQMGREKWAKLGAPYALADAAVPDAALTERVRGQFRRQGLHVC